MSNLILNKEFWNEEFYTFETNFLESTFMHLNYFFFFKKKVKYVLSLSSFGEFWN